MNAPTVLVVEDNPANMKLAAMLLEHAGYRVLSATTAAEGIALARERMPQLVLMDIQLPGMDGLDATRVLKADPATRGIQVVALTAFAMKGEETRILEAGCDGYITKPIDYKCFLAEVTRRLGVAGGTPP
ncbi:response regulator [Pseudothauera rhizosphaerae]|uniref:Response regulator n=1 Tax=Pseudothauera rhizosphaerae TaxID=2565932 RepID=A0A4V3WBB2_9RHOO|nr:response regulator [Pseudothauera rhizosphaerae]THF62577.1 response regulator [Pseudothauera rhizosphaerae]